DPASLPAWTTLFNDLLPFFPTSADQIAELHRDPIFDPQRPVPFEIVFLPFVLYARALVERLPQAISRQLAPTAWQSLERRLLEDLSRLGAFSLGRQFQKSRLARDPLALFGDPAGDL